MKHTALFKRLNGRPLIAVRLIWLTLLMALLLSGLASLTALAQDPGDVFIAKSVSQEGATVGMTLTFSIDVHNPRNEDLTVNVVDTLPAELNYLSSPQNPTIDQNKNTLTFSDVNLPPGQGARLEYSARVSETAQCGQELWNQAQVTDANGDPLSNVAQVRVYMICSDLGDAPASDNNYFLPMTIPGGANATYPTVYNPPNGAPDGPRHQRADLLHLGDKVSPERQADVGSDLDPTNNILPSLGQPDMDMFDDGWLNPTAVFTPCQFQTLEFKVSIDSILPQYLEEAYLNVWFDGNRNGSWGDLNPCDNNSVPEHIVIDHPVNIAAGVHTVTLTTTVPVFNDPADQPAWTRVTLSEQPSVKTGVFTDAAGATHPFGDGRGVKTSFEPLNKTQVHGFWLGETEDYLHLPDSNIQPGLDIKKLATSDSAFGSVISYTALVSNTHDFSVPVRIIDHIPPLVNLVPNSVHASSGSAGYDPTQNAVFWSGEIPPKQVVTLEFAAEVTQCDPYGFTVLNRAMAVEPGFPPVSAEASTAVADCTAPPPPREVTVEKFGPPAIVPGASFDYLLKASNYSTAPLQLEITDPLPLEVTLMTDTLTLSNMKFIPPNLLVWEPTLRPGETLSATFGLELKEGVCGRKIINQAFWQAGDLEGHSNPLQTEVICPDLGDAPDSTFNHHNLTNMAYIIDGTANITANIAGNFPTVWEPAPGAPDGTPSGPLHADLSHIWLGNHASAEIEADIGPDQDGLNNILANGADNANNDRADDGWLNKNIPLADCHEATLSVRVYKNNPFINQAYLNVWFDGNRDGDWADWKYCDDQRMAFEWIVQDFVVDMSAWPAGTYQDIPVRTLLISNNAPQQQAWMRFTLSEQRAPVVDNPTGPSLADGRGPLAPMSYQVGETEDYLLPGQSEGGNPGQLSIKKIGPIVTQTIGSVYTYSVIITNTGGTAPTPAVMQDNLPPAVAIVGPPQLNLMSPYSTTWANPLNAYFDPGQGSNGAVGWIGDLSPNAIIKVDFPVEVLFCPENDPNHKIRNDAFLLPPVSLTSTVYTPIKCQDVEPPDLHLSKRIVTDLNEELPEWTTVPGEFVRYKLVFSGTTGITRPIHIQDVLTRGQIAVAANASYGAAQIVDGGHELVWDGSYGPASPPLAITVMVELRDLPCGGEIPNQASWESPFIAGGHSNSTILKLACPDLGDAPDSRNHYATPMTAYPTITATFPTVTWPVSSTGPVHLNPRWLHLGPRVSFEIEADLGMDMDGVNNILPLKNKPNLDKADDGLLRSTLTFSHCQIHSFPVLVSINPQAIAHLTANNGDGKAYLNVWLDSNRNGNWGDVFTCTNQTEALEHIVIDRAIDVAALGPGMHSITVTTTSPVFWLNNMRDKPAWLRATLSGAPVYKPFTSHGGVKYSDGRGGSVGSDGKPNNDPFQLGETEDYLLRGPDEAPQADPTVEKRGSIHPFFEFDPAAPAAGRQVWNVEWQIHYQNIGSDVANPPTIIDTFDPRQKLMFEESFPLLPASFAGNAITYNSPSPLHPAEDGGIFIVTQVPFTTAPGTILTNTVSISSSNDAYPGNNRAVFTQTVPLLPPFITYPLPGTTCTGTLTISGRVQLPGIVVEVFVDGAPVFTDTADSQGRWSGSLTLPDGDHTIQARALNGSRPSPLSPPILLGVDTTMAWSPISLRFSTIDDDGNRRVIIPRDENGRTDASGWTVFLRPGKTYTVSVRLCCSDPNALVSLKIPGGQTVTLTDADGDHWFQAVFTMPDEGSMAMITDWEITLCVVCYNVQYCASGTVLIDPEGVVFDVDQGQDSGLLEDAAVACYEGSTDVDSGETTFNLWPAENYSQINPQTTLSDGYFSFFTPPGTFRLNASKTGYQPYRSPNIVVADKPVEYNVPLTKIISQTTDYTVTVSAAGFSPAILTVEPGAVIKWLNVDVAGASHTTTSITPTALITANTRALAHTDGWDSGLLSPGESYSRQLNTIGDYTYQDSENSAYSGMVIVRAKQFIYLPLVLKN